MTDNDFGDFFVSESEVDLARGEDEPLKPPVVVPPPVAGNPEGAPPDPVASSDDSEISSTPVHDGAQAPPLLPADAPAPVASAATVPEEPDSVSPATTDTRPRSREERLAAALGRLLEDSQDIEAAALVSLDGFTMASALPAGMQEDRVGAMSAAILGLGERAAVELGKGKLSQVFIEGDGGYVMLIAAGERAVLTCLADEDAKLGLVLYDMRLAAQSIGEILG